jgi:hypothetical protein
MATAKPMASVQPAPESLGGKTRVSKTAPLHSSAMRSQLTCWPLVSRMRSAACVPPHPLAKPHVADGRGSGGGQDVALPVRASAPLAESNVGGVRSQGQVPSSCGNKTRIKPPPPLQLV